ncbi:DUF3102 domain-containing protein [Nonomuraea sp. NPDC050643]|uniref:DUF3102 domain-containing protein n=1 Tax=Nonomuraea sp. NPDC050643 TaxID=3155660 RepID=UPI00340ABF56
MDSIVETGRRLIEAKQRVGHGNWLPTVEMLPFSEATARKLMAISTHPDLANRSHGNDLPASWSTLYVLAQLPPGEIPKRIEAGEITPELDRSTAQTWVSTYAASRQEALNAWSGAVDGLTRALSYAKTYKPPIGIPENYVSVADFAERAESLLEIAQGWDA